jgi:glyoxylase-like metal-dependent hydrolase (beta-lactamase superfamily II)
MALKRKTEQVLFPTKWTENIWLLGIQEFPYYFVSGTDCSVIIEGGVSGAVPKVIKHMAETNVNAPLKHLIITHTHTDHITGLMKLKRLMPEVLLTASKESADVLSKEKVVSHFVFEDLVYSDFLVKEGLADEVPEMLPLDPVKIDSIVRHGDMIDLGGIELEFIEAPGHAPGNMVILVKPDNVMLISDTAGYAEAKDDVLPLFFHDFNASIETLEMLKSYKPDHIGLGHNLRIDGAGECIQFLDFSKKMFFEMKDEIVTKVNGGCTNKEIEDEFSKRITGYGLFSHFGDEVLKGFVSIITKRAFGE